MLVTWAISDGGPGLSFDEHIGGSSTLVTKKPISGSSAFGLASSCNMENPYKLLFYLDYFMSCY